MANIDNELLSICAASEGSKVRASIAKALQRINDDRRYAVNNRKKITSEDNHKTLTGGPWDIIDVDVNEGEVNVKGGATSLDDFGVVTQNGYYDLWNTNWPAGHGWQSFTVDISGADYFSGERTITQNGEYFAEYDGFDGYSKVYVNVPDGGQETQQFKVVFHDQWQNPIEEKIVNFGETAVFTGQTPQSDTPFMRWDPEPVNVAYNMNCYPVFYDAGYRGTINDDWRTIQKNLRNGTAPSKYRIGDTRVIPCDGFNTEVEMVLIAMGAGLQSHDHKFEYRRDTNVALSNIVSLWISKTALYGSRIKPEEVLDEKNDILRKEWYYDAQSMFQHRFDGLVSDVNSCYITWDAITYYYFIRGVSWIDTSRSGQSPIPQHVIGEDRISYEGFSNGGLYEIADYEEVLRNLDIWTNRYYQYPTASPSIVSIMLDTYDITGNVPSTQNVHNEDTDLYGMIKTSGSKYNHFFHTGTLYSPQEQTLSETLSSALIPDYRGSVYNRPPYSTETGVVKRSVDGVGSVDTGYSREFLIL